MTGHRRFLLLLGALAASRGAGAQVEKRAARIGYLATTDPKRTPGLEAFRDGMRSLGWTEGKNLAIEYRWAEGRFEPGRNLAAELVGLNVDLIFTWGSPATAAAKKATSTIPIVFTWVADPVASGFVKSLARPEANLTGMSNAVHDVSAKNVTLFSEAVPAMRRLGIVRNPDNPNARPLLQQAEGAARARKLEYRVFDLRGPADFAPAFAAMAKERMEGLVFLGDPMILGRRRELAELAIKHRLPTIYNNLEYPAVGGLMSYGADPHDVFRRTATYVDRVLRGAKPGDLPVAQPTNMKLVINLRTAKTLGLALPQSVLARADELIR